MITRSIVLFGCLLAAACGPSVATYGETTPDMSYAPVQRPPVQQVQQPQAGQPAEKFGNYNDDASDSFLTRQVQKNLEREVLEERRRAQEAEILRLQAQSRAQQPRQAQVREEAMTARSGGHYFPWNTLLWGGLGAAIGSHEGKAGEGAAIGAGLGLLFDAARWW